MVALLLKTNVLQLYLSIIFKDYGIQLHLSSQYSIGFNTEFLTDLRPAKCITESMGFCSKMF